MPLPHEAPTSSCAGTVAATRTALRTQIKRSMNHKILLALAATTLSAATAASAEQALPPANTFGLQPSAWQPTISVATGAHGLALRSEPIAAAEFEPQTASQTGAPASLSTQSGSVDRGSSVGRALSDSIVPFGIASGIFLLADGRNHPGQTRGAIEGVGATAVITELLKYTVHERRPSGGPHSFPSGHASFAFALATAVGENHRSARLPLFGLATAIAASRVDVHAHYTHDVIAGAAIGYFTTKYFMRRNHREPAASGTASASSSGLGMSSRGVSFARSF